MPDPSPRALSRTVGLAIAGSILLALPRPGESPSAIAASGALGALGFALWALALAGSIGEPPRQAMGLDRPDPLRGRVAVRSILGFLGASQLVAWALDTTFGPAAAPPAVDAARGAAPGALALLAVGVALAPAIAEELLFRGAILRGLCRVMPWPPAIGLSAAAFALPHLRSGSAIAAGVLGLYLALLVREGGGIRVAILCHAANNLCVLGAASLEPAAIPASLVLAWWGACAVGLALTLASWTRRESIPHRRGD